MTRASFNCALALTTIGALSACATPGIDYQAKIMASSVEAAETRNVAVERFSGPAGGWYAARFEAMLANTTFDGAPWFSLAAYGQGIDAPAGTYTGDVEILSYDWFERDNIVKKCVEWDGLFDCETRAEVLEVCLEEEVRVRVTPRLFDADTGQLVFSGTYEGDAGQESCRDVGILIDGKLAKGKRGKGKRGQRGPRHGGGLFGFAGAVPPAGLVREALSETLRPIRNDIAPRNAKVRANFITKPLDPMAAADPRFEQAVKAARRDPFLSCSLWTTLAANYPDAPAVLHNQGACAEAQSDFSTAQGLYAKASELAVRFSSDGTAPKVFLKSLRSLNTQRVGLEIIEEITNPQPLLGSPNS